MSDLKATIRAAVPPKLWASLRRLRFALHTSRFGHRVVTHTYHGQTLRVHLADGVGEGWYDHDWPVQPEIAELSRHKLRPGAVVYDCGAHQCVVALVLAGIVGPTGRVVAVEANAHDVAVARRNVADNQAGRGTVEVVHAAVAAADGTMHFGDDVSTQVAASARLHAAVDAITLDTLSRRYPLPDVLFIDIEGAETLALAACDTLFRDGNRPDWFVEVHGGVGLEKLGGTVESIVRFFRDRHYRVVWADPAVGTFTPIADPLPTGRFYLVATSE